MAPPNFDFKVPDALRSELGRALQSPSEYPTKDQLHIDYFNSTNPAQTIEMNN